MCASFWFPPTVQKHARKYIRCTKLPISVTEYMIVYAWCPAMNSHLPPSTRGIGFISVGSVHSRNICQTACFSDVQFCSSRFSAFQEHLSNERKTYNRKQQIARMENWGIRMPPTFVEYFAMLRQQAEDQQAVLRKQQVARNYPGFNLPMPRHANRSRSPGNSGSLWSGLVPSPTLPPPE
ncbi:uncharacterized protein LOC124626488 [Ictalurus punctatus]|uniref:Uncharacterized protein LOC124626488 n=1 Tax=Ictalurus punctatus TaxID=7998 RepID=A0A9F7QZD1_ICTPU|nr:uncharacterized protein LOC124626488 [Ictalurus punctatus]